MERLQRKIKDNFYVIRNWLDNSAESLACNRVYFQKPIKLKTLAHAGLWSVLSS